MKKTALFLVIYRAVYSGNAGEIGRLKTLL